MKSPSRVPSSREAVDPSPCGARLEEAIVERFGQRQGHSPAIRAAPASASARLHLMASVIGHNRRDAFTIDAVGPHLVDDEPFRVETVAICVSVQPVDDRRDPAIARRPFIATQQPAPFEMVARLDDRRGVGRRRQRRVEILRKHPLLALEEPGGEEVDQLSRPCRETDGLPSTPTGPAWPRTDACEDFAGEGPFPLGQSLEVAAALQRRHVAIQERQAFRGQEPDRSCLPVART